MSNVSRYENLSKQELEEVIKFGFTRVGFYKFKLALSKAKEIQSCKLQK